LVYEKNLRQNGRNRYYHILYGLDDDARFDERVSESEYQRLKVGDTINLRVLPGHPDIARLEKSQ
jgi:hypothetical protein